MIITVPAVIIPVRTAATMVLEATTRAAALPPEIIQTQTAAILETALIQEAAIVRAEITAQGTAITKAIWPGKILTDKIFIDLG